MYENDNLDIKKRPSTNKLYFFFRDFTFYGRITPANMKRSLYDITVGYSD